MTMRTHWLLVLMVFISSQSVESQSTTDGEVCDGQQLNELKRHMTALMSMLSSQQIMLQQLQTVLNRLDNQRPRDCSEIIFDSGECSDGVYTVYVGKSQLPVEVYCDMTTDGGGWTVFQRRQDGSEDFYRNWTDYATGFGNPAGEFWLGNDNLHLLTSEKRQQLRIDLADFEGNSRYAKYDDFKVDSACAQYNLTSLGAYSGTATDSLTRHVGHKFSTPDHDNDVWPDSCAVTFKGSWWYDKCHESNLNGLYLRGAHSSYADGVNWKHWTGYHYSLKFTEMKIRPR